MVHLNRVVFGLGMFFPPVKTLSKQNSVMRRIMRKPLKLKVRRYATRMKDLNGNLAEFLGEKQVR